MQLLSSKKPKTSTAQYVDQNPVEAIRNVGGGTVKSFTEQLFGKRKEENKQNTSGELLIGQDLNLASLKKTEQRDVEPGIDYKREIIHGEEKRATHYSKALEQQIEMIIIELKRLASSSKEIEIQFRDVVVEQRIERVGKYHQSFFEWMLVIVQTARMRVEDAGAWLQVVKGKKNKKQQQNYWQMFKKHGTTFGLSNERVLSTQTG